MGREVFVAAFSIERSEQPADGVASCGVVYLRHRAESALPPCRRVENGIIAGHGGERDVRDVTRDIGHDTRTGRSCVLEVRSVGVAFILLFRALASLWLCEPTL